MSERAARVWAWVGAAHDNDTPVTIAALCRAAALRLGVDGASVTAMSGPVAREPVCASDEVSARLEELQFTMGEGPGADDYFRAGSPMLIAELDSVAARWPGFASGDSDHQRRTISTSVVAAWKPPAVIGCLARGTQGNTAQPRAA